jgi:hypothetical protein
MSGLKQDFFPYFTYTQTVANDSTINEIASRLKFIGRIQRGEKVDVSRKCVLADTWYNNIWRTIWGTESREATLEFIDKTVKCGLEFALQTSSNQQNPFRETTVQSILQDLANACNGMENLKDTYKCDLMFGCQMDTLIHYIQTRLSQMGYEQQLTLLTSVKPHELHVATPQKEPEPSRTFIPLATTPPIPIPSSPTLSISPDYSTASSKVAVPLKNDDATM